MFEYIKNDAEASGYNILYNEGPKDIPVAKFRGNGIRVLMHNDHGNQYIRFIINLHAVLHTYDPLKLISPCEASEALDKTNDMLVNWLGEEYSIDKLALSRVDCCVNINVETAEYVTAYIKQLYRTKASKGFKTVSYKKQGFNKDAGYTAERRHKGEEISVYDKQKQIESTQSGLKCPEAEGILRAEVRHKSTAIHNMFGYTLDNRKIIQHFIADSRRIISNSLSSLLIDADYYKTDKAQRLIDKNIHTNALRKRMIRFVALVSTHRGILKARDAHNAENKQVTGKYYKVMREAFMNINVNPVPLPSSGKLKTLPSLFRFLE